MKTSPLVVCLFCISAIPVADALAGGNKHGPRGHPSGFPSVPQAPKFIGAGFTPPGLPVNAVSAAALPTVTAPALNAGALGNGAGVAAPAVGGGAAGMNLPAGQVIGNSPGMPAHGRGVVQGLRDGKELDDRDGRRFPGKAQQHGFDGKLRKKLAVPTGETDAQTASSQSSTTRGEIAAEAAGQANQLAAQTDTRQLPSCR